MSYCEWPEFYSESFPKARKQYWCCECAAPIAVGEKHLYWRGKWGGDFSDGRQHMLCREACMLLNSDRDECFGFGDLWEEWGQHGYSEKDWLRYDHKPAVLAEAAKARGLIARIKWRQRPFRTRRKRVQGVLMHRKLGQPWIVIEEKRN